jgi:hypothetical protein
MNTLLRVLSLVALLPLFACSSPTPQVSSDSGAGDAASDGASRKGFDCIAFRDWQLQSSCPKFNGANYVKDCENTKASIAPACSAKADALADCVLAQPAPPCTPSGTIDDTVPAACKAAEDDFLKCK